MPSCVSITCTPPGAGSMHRECGVAAQAALAVSDWILDGNPSRSMVRAGCLLVWSMPSSNCQLPHYVTSRLKSLKYFFYCQAERVVY